MDSIYERTCALARAVQDSRLDVVRVLYDDARPDDKDGCLRAILFESCKSGNRVIIEYALARTEELRALGTKVYSALFSAFKGACYNGQLALVREMYDHCEGDDEHETATRASQGFMIAIETWNEELMKFFETHGTFNREGCFVGAIPGMIRAGNLARINRAMREAGEIYYGDLASWARIAIACGNVPILSRFLQCARGGRPTVPFTPETRARFDRELAKIVSEAISVTCSWKAWDVRALACTLRSLGLRANAADLSDQNMQIARDLGV
jgi:hypothetical protein